jgi:hypothetical protein
LYRATVLPAVLCWAESNCDATYIPVESDNERFI